MKADTISFLVLGIVFLIAVVAMGMVVMDAASWLDVNVVYENQF